MPQSAGKSKRHTQQQIRLDPVYEEARSLAIHESKFLSLFLWFWMEKTIIFRNIDNLTNFSGHMSQIWPLYSVKVDFIHTNFVFLTLDGCNDNGRFYRMNDEWERPYMDSTLICTCQGPSGVKCNSKPAGDCFYYSDSFILSYDTLRWFFFPYAFYFIVFFYIVCNNAQLRTYVSSERVVWLFSV